MSKRDVHILINIVASASTNNIPLLFLCCCAFIINRAMFKDAKAFNQALDNWDTAKVTTMESVFDALCETMLVIVSSTSSASYLR